MSRTASRLASDLRSPCDTFGVGKMEFTCAGARVWTWYPTARNTVAARPGDSDRLDVGVSHVNPAATATPFPVVLYYPGWPGTHVDNFDLICYLACQGFAVLAVTYPPSPDDAAWDHSSPAAHARTVTRVEARLQARAADAAALLGALRQQHGALAGTALEGRLALEQIGLLGFSFGGAIAAEASRRVPGVAGVINLDGRHWGSALEHGVACPYLFIGERLQIPSQQALTDARPEIRYEAELDRRDYAQLAHNLKRNRGCRIEVPNARHADFTDEALRRRIGRMLLGSARRSRGIASLIKNYSRAFFRAALLGEDSPLLAADASLAPYARFAVWNR